MKTYIKLPLALFIALLSFSVGYGQDKNEKKANEKFDNYAYADAIDTYEHLIEKGYDSEEIYKRLGNANYLNANYKKAAEWYGRLFAIENATIDAEYLYKYAQTLKSLEKYDASDQWMQKFEAAKAQDKRVMQFAKNTDYLEKIKEQSGRYDIKNLAINSSASDFAPSFYGTQLIFSTARDTGIVSRTTHLWNKKPFLNLFVSEPSESGDYTTSSKFSKVLNTKTHESSAVFTKDGNTVYFTRNNSKNRTFARDAEGVSRLKIYRANLQDGEWTNIVALPFNGDDYSVAHPALSPDETILYFSSDMPGTTGKSDIFSVSIGSDGNFGTPINLGETINTEGRETFPFVTEAKVLYFASDGHPGLGGLDVYATRLEDMDDLYIVNVGEPVNSIEDDFSYVINEETSKGFFASNRDGGKGSDDIYSFVQNTPPDLICNTLVSGIVKDQETAAPLEGAKVAIFNSESEVVAETISNADGTFNLEGDCKEDSYKLVVLKDEYDEGNEMFTTVNANDTEGIEVALERSIKRAAIGTDLVQFLEINPVYFDLDKSNIRPDAEQTLSKVIEYLAVFPDMYVQVQSHTDVRASTSYNERLSDRRAKETVAYLIAKGIDTSRISGKGFGESQLVNDCTTRDKCSDEQHQQNRRSEFIVITKEDASQNE